jgi:hypothetical protein
MELQKNLNEAKFGKVVFYNREYKN